MATPTVPKKNRGSKLLQARRKAVKFAKDASTKYGKSLKQSQAAKLLKQATAGKLKIPYPKGALPAGSTSLVNRAAGTLGKGLLGRTTLAIQGYNTARNVFNPDDNIITSLRNLNRVARGEEALGTSDVAQAYNKRRMLKIEGRFPGEIDYTPISNPTSFEGKINETEPIRNAFLKDKNYNRNPFLGMDEEIDTEEVEPGENTDPTGHLEEVEPNIKKLNIGETSPNPAKVIEQQIESDPTKARYGVSRSELSAVERSALNQSPARGSVGRGKLRIREINRLRDRLNKLEEGD